MRDPFDEMGQLNDELNSLSGKFVAATERIVPTTAKDGTGAVSVTIDRSGKITAIAVSARWADHYSAETLVSGINEAVMTAATARFEQYGTDFADESIEPVRLPAPLAHEGLAGQLAEVVQNDTTGSPDATMNAITQLLTELNATIDQVTEDIKAMQSREYSAQSPNGHVRATLLGNGTIVDLRFDKTWLDRAHVANIGREAVQAIQETYRRIAGDDVQTIIDKSVIGRITRLTEDPAALAREFHLRD